MRGANFEVLFIKSRSVLVLNHVPIVVLSFQEANNPLITFNPILSIYNPVQLFA